MIGDFERISDHAVNVLESAEELRQKGLSFSEAAMDELRSLTGAVGEILDLSHGRICKERSRSSGQS